MNIASAYYGDDCVVIVDSDNKKHFLQNGSTGLIKDRLDKWLSDGGVIDGRPLNEVKQNKITSLNTECLKAINGGFESDALGSIHKYDSEGINREWIQAKAVESSLLNEDQYITADDLLGNPDSKPMRLHTPEQCAQVLKDGSAALLAHKMKFRALRDQVLDAATDTETKVNAINW